MKNIRKNIEIRRFLEWSKIVRGKPIQIRLYEEWCLKRKSEQIDDVTKKERFDVTKDLPIKISTQ